MNDFQTMTDYYPFLVEYCIEFKRFSRKYLAELKGNSQTALLKAVFSHPLINAVVLYNVGLGNLIALSTHQGRVST